MNTTSRALYPGIKVKLIGEDGNAFVLIGLVRKALRNHRVPAHVIEEFVEEATAGDYNHLLGTILNYVEIQ